MDKKTPREKMIDLLSHPLKGSTDTTDILTRIFRMILQGESITPDRWNLLIERYLRKMENFRTLDSHKAGTIRGNLNKAFIEKPKMTFNTLKRGIQFLGFDEMEIVLRLKKGNKVSEYSEKVKFNK